MDQQVFVATVVDELPPVPVAPWRHTLWVLTAYYALAAVWGARSVIDAELPAVDVVLPCVFFVALGWWCLVDARRRKHPIPMSSRPWFFVLAPVLVPGYVIWSRGWRGAGWVALHAALGYGVATIAVYVVWTAVYGPWW